MERYTDSQTWFAIFDKCHGKYWWKYLLHPQFQHVHLVRDNRDYALMVNGFAHAMAVREYPNTLEDFLKQEIEQNPTAILQLTVHYHSHYRPFPIEIHSCVSIAKRLLCIRKRIYTPKALYHEMIKAGAVIIKPYVVL